MNDGQRDSALARIERFVRCFDEERVSLFDQWRVHYNDVTRFRVDAERNFAPFTVILGWMLDTIAHSTVLVLIGVLGFNLITREIEPEKKSFSLCESII